MSIHEAGWKALGTDFPSGSRAVSYGHLAHSLLWLQTINTKLANMGRSVSS